MLISCYSVSPQPRNRNLYMYIDSKLFNVAFPNHGVKSHLVWSVGWNVRSNLLFVTFVLRWIEGYLHNKITFPCTPILFLEGKERRCTHVSKSEDDLKLWICPWEFEKHLNAILLPGSRKKTGWEPLIQHILGA